MINLLKIRNGYWNAGPFSFLLQSLIVIRALSRVSIHPLKTGKCKYPYIHLCMILSLLPLMRKHFLENSVLPVSKYPLNTGNCYAHVHTRSLFTEDSSLRFLVIVKRLFGITTKSERNVSSVLHEQ